MNDDLIRTFIAADVSPTVKEALERAIEPIRHRTQSGDRRTRSTVTWTGSAAWHLTLKFLGELNRQDVDRVIAAMTEAAARFAPFESVLSGWGAFPNEYRPRVLWLGVARGAEELTAAARTLDTRLAAEGFPREEKPFHPHLTIARVREGAAGPRSRDGSDRVPRLLEGAEALRRLQAVPFRSDVFPTDRLVVYRSVLDRGGARYHPLADCPFG